MSGHSVTVKRADEVQVGDFINAFGSASEVTSVTSGGGLLEIVVEHWFAQDYRPDELVEVMDK